MYPALKSEPPSPPTSSGSWRERAIRLCGEIATEGEFRRRGEWQTEWERCARDIAYWFNTYVKTYDPRLLPDDPNVPFRLFPKQEEFLRWLSERISHEEDGLAEKSRDCGLSFLCGGYALHQWLFTVGFSAGFGSQKQDKVDRIGDPDSLFEKMRIMLRSLPPWMQPYGFKPTDHDNFLRLINPENGSTITGEAGDNIGRGGRKKVYFVDEAAFIERPDLIEASLSATTRCRIYVSTPNGAGNAFYRKRFGGELPVFTFHWKDDPRKNAYLVKDASGAVVAEGQGYAPPPPQGGSVEYPWYIRDTRGKDPVIVAQEYDIDYAASIEGIAIPAKWVQAAVGLRLKNPDGSDYEPSAAVVCGLDVAGGSEGGDENVLIGRRGPLVMEPHAWNGLSPTRTAWRARDLAGAMGAEVVHYDAIGVGEGVGGTWEASEIPLPFTANPVKWGAPASDKAFWPDGLRSSDKFRNQRAELWGLMRERFRKSYEYATEGIPHPPDEMISLPSDPLLIAQLSLPKFEETENGKLRLESKKKMKERGVSSPDRADALAYSFAPEPVRWTFG